MNLGLDLSLNARRGGATLSSTEQLLALLNAAGGQSSYHNFATATNSGTWTSVDQTTNGKNFTQATATYQPTIGAGGATFDGSNDAVGMTISGGTLTMVCSLTKSDASTSGVICSDNAGGANSNYNSASSTALTYTTTVNGASVATRLALYTALHQTGERVLTVNAIDATGDTAIRMGTTSGSFGGVIRKVAILDNVALGSNLSAAVALAQSAVAS